MSWAIQGLQREALVFPPATVPASGKVPMLFVFHGHGDSAQDAAEHMRFQREWPEALVVYMQGLPTASRLDPAGKLAGWQNDVGENTNRDLLFVDAVFGTLLIKYPLDQSRIYATGFSNGASFTYVLWSARPNLFAAFAACAGRIAPGFKQASVPKPMFHIAGRTDRLAPFDLQMRSVAAAREVDGASGAGEPCGNGCTRYASTKDAPVVVREHPGGHTFPPFAAAEIVEFFKAHSLPAE